MASNPTLITTPFAASGDKTTPPNTNTPSDGRFSQTLGFPPVTAIPLGSGGKAPKREDFNGAFNMISNILFYAQKGFTFNWDSGQAYYTGCRVIDSSDGNMYVCISDVAAGQTRPMNNAAKWKKASMVGGGGNIGDIISFAGNGTPDGFLLCDGSVVSRSTYSDLFSVIGTTYGGGDGSTTYNLPTEQFLTGISASLSGVIPVIYGNDFNVGDGSYASSQFKGWQLLSGQQSQYVTPKVSYDSTTLPSGWGSLPSSKARPCFVDSSDASFSASTTYSSNIKYYIRYE